MNQYAIANQYPYMMINGTKIIITHIEHHWSQGGRRRWGRRGICIVNHGRGEKLWRIHYCNTLEFMVMILVIMSGINYDLEDFPIVILTVIVFVVASMNFTPQVVLITSSIMTMSGRGHGRRIGSVNGSLINIWQIPRHPSDDGYGDSLLYPVFQFRSAFGSVVTVENLGFDRLLSMDRASNICIWNCRTGKDSVMWITIQMTWMTYIGDCELSIRHRSSKPHRMYLLPMPPSLLVQMLSTLESTLPKSFASILVNLILTYAIAF